MNNPFFSVIIPSYNRSLLLKEAILSVASQSFHDYELLVIDDGSTDDTDSMVRQLDVPLYYTKTAHCGKPSILRNRLAAQAKGRYLTFLDSDDLWLPQKLAEQYRQIISTPNIKLFHTKEQWLRCGKEVSQAGQKHQSEGDIFEDSLNKCIIGPSTAAIETNFFRELKGFNEELEIAEDYELWLRALCFTEAAYISTPLVVKRAGEWDNLSEKYHQIEVFRIQALQSLLKKPFLNETQRLLTQSELGRKISLYLAGCFKRQKWQEARLYAKDLSDLLEKHHE